MDRGEWGWGWEGGVDRGVWSVGIEGVREDGRWEGRLWVGEVGYGEERED